MQPISATTGVIKFILRALSTNTRNILTLRLPTYRNLDSTLTATITLTLNLFFTLLFTIDLVVNKLFTVEVYINTPKVNLINFTWVNPCIKLGSISDLSSFQFPLDFKTQSPFDLRDTKGWTSFKKCGNYYQCQPSLFMDPALTPKACTPWKTKNEALLERINLNFSTNIVHITQWRSTAVSIAGSSVMDIFICTSSEYFYTFRAEYFYKNNSIAALRKLLPPITEELLQSVIAQLPPSNTKPFYLSDNLSLPLITAYLHQLTLARTPLVIILRV